MIVSITITAKAGGGWTVQYSTSASLAERELGRLDSFPLPPQGEAARWKDKAYESLCVAADATAHEIAIRKILVGNADGATRQNFGNYLTALLLGPHLDTFENLKAGEPVELYIITDDPAIRRLPWELMYGGAEPLSASGARTFAIVRVVKSEKQVATTPLGLPLRVLFVVGQTMDDSIRPGAEYMALLRRIAGDDLDPRVANLNSRLLLHATVADVAKAVDDLKPAVIHFICHGDFNGKEATLLLTGTDMQHPEKPQALTAPELLDLMKGASKTAPLPSVVVLNACHTGEAKNEADRKAAYRGFGATLVREGVPMVLGMAGEVADGACRVFTTEFYQALLKGDSVVLASGRGRRAALRGYSGYQHTSEWARPTLFVAGEAVASFPLVLDGKALGTAAAKFVDINDPRALCGRLKCITSFETLLGRVLSGSGKRFVLAYGVTAPTGTQEDGHTPRYGKSRMLEELAVRLALAGVAPVLLPRERKDPPSNVLALVFRLLESMKTTRKRFGVKTNIAPTAVTPLIDFLVDELGLEAGRAKDAEISVGTLNKLRVAVTAQETKIPDGTIRNLFAQELAQLVDELKPEGVSHAAVLIDDLHSYEGCLSSLFGMLGDEGLGEGSIVPLIFTYVRGGKDQIGADPVGQRISQELKDKGYVDEDLGVFADEEPLAHRQYLLTRRSKPLAINNDPKLDDLAKKFLKRICALTGGIPSRWETDKVRELLMYYHEDFELLVDANDEEIVERFGS